MELTKSITHEEQVTALVNKGCIISDKESCIRFLSKGAVSNKLVTLHDRSEKYMCTLWTAVLCEIHQLTKITYSSSYNIRTESIYASIHVKAIIY